MISLRDYIFESKKHVDQTTIGDFAKWACLGEMPDGKPGKVKPEDCEGLIDNGWFEYFEDDDNTKRAWKLAADFLNKNWDESIKVTSEETANDWEVWFKFDNRIYSAAFVTYFGDTFDDKY